MIRKLTLIAGLLVLIIALSACGGGDKDNAPDLSAPPTRTPVPPTATPAPNADQQSSVLENARVISIVPEVNAFLTAAAEASPLDRPLLFEEHFVRARPECVTSTFVPGVTPLEMFGAALDLVSLELDAWTTAVTLFPEAELQIAVNDMLTRAEDLLTMDSEIRICILPIPGRGAPPEQPNGGVDAQVLGGDLVLAWCSAGDYCLPYFGQQIAYSFHYAYQIAQAEAVLPEMSLLNMAIFNARAADFTRHLYPDASFPWQDALTADQEIILWENMSPYLATTYQQYPDYRKIDRFLYGFTNPDLYPAWGGLYVGERILSAYRTSHPNVTFAELATLAPQTILEESGYTPGE